MKTEIKKIIEEIIGKPLDREEGLLEFAVLDSLATVQLITKLESKYKISFDPEDFNFELFDSLHNLVTLVEKMKSEE